MSDKVLSKCCGWPLEHYCNGLGQSYYWCRICEHPLLADGSKNNDQHSFHPYGDLRKAFDLLERYMSFQATQKGVRSYTERERVLWCRSAFFAGAKWRERVSCLSGDKVHEAMAEQTYPIPRYEP